MSIISIEHLSKQYRLGARQSPYGTLRESLVEALRSPVRRLRQSSSALKSTIWALRDISLEVSEGEVMGIIGHNGAGKSTLFKVLSRVTEPTSGSVRLYGHVASLLEVGTGFHPELTGRENVFLSGALMGMRRAEIKRKFDEIVAFAETEKFLDTPVKHYSSGMYVRLAFAVAAHMEPDILVIDEVLSVGDMAFQKKCLQKIDSLKKRTKAILLVSHNMISIRTICSRVVLMSQGKIVDDGTPARVVPLYDKLVLANEGSVADEVSEGMGLIRITAVQLTDEHGREKGYVETGEPVKVTINYVATDLLENVVVYAAIRRPDDFICIGTSTRLEQVPVPPLRGPGTVKVEFPELSVVPGYYVLDVTFYDHNFEFRTYFLGRKRIGFRVESNLPSLDDKYGVVYQKQIWDVTQVNQESDVR